MGLLDKVKNFFYDEEDYTDEYEPVVVEPKKTKKKVEYTNVEEPRKRENKKVKSNEEISEVELFKADRTFNFPMDLDDTIFEKSTKEKNEKKIVKKDEVTSINTYRSTTAYQKRTYPTEKIDSSKEPKRFTPTPIISPIYGVLDKNYKKEDTAIDSGKNYNITKTLDYDAVMKKAMKNKEDDNKSIFFNLEDEEKGDTDEIKIIYNDVSTNEDMGNTNKEDTINNTLVDEDNILSETNEQDLFNLIDNMYSTDEDDEEDE